ncbi:endosomal peripheral membrane protein [Cordyceps javanica]|uniref:Endosomal peripheral membrane protein n=1 Tax=Cordyceps javanica TaxID=43265 RepID=A0A545V6Y1_9HYPO|nr:endosomal peripheral membrane protein [Cordyceps javanica]TQW09336.1 endosomal peripheral membrane protein [Cordyceps javanica]
MTAQLLATELANLIQESKRKHNDLRQAAEKSLEDLKQLGPVSESAISDQLSQKTNFVNPFIIACGTKNAKFTSIAIVCLQRLIVASALPRSKLNQVLEALMQASSAALDVQLKILQALPSLLQNYAIELQGELLVTTLNICFILQSSKNAIVNNTSAATLQQLVVAVFDKVVTEDKNASNEPFVGEAATADGKVELRAAALDAYRIFNDLCLLTENQRPEYMRFTGLHQTFGLELIESVITNHGNLLATHPEQVQVLRVRVMPLIVSALKGKPTFSTSVRLVRILYTLLRRHISLLPAECGEALDILTQLMDHDSLVWKRALCMEVFRGLFAEHALIREIYALYDAKKGQKDVFKTLVAVFVRLGTEKPAVIGLSHQSTIPASDNRDSQDASDQAVLEASGVGGIMGGTSSAESSHVGISSKWSTVRIPCIDQLDKTEPPPIPETYVYSLILACISSLSDGLAKFILPLTVSNDSKGRRKVSPQESTRDSPQQLEAESSKIRTRPERSSSFKKNPIPVNPLTLESHPLHSEVIICSSIVDECWPAILATCSNFLYASLDSEYYHGLVRAFQRFAHVAGLLQLSTPRDAFLTTLGKSAVPPNVLTACLSAGQSRPTISGTVPESPASTILSNARGLLSVETLQTQSVENKRQPTADVSSASLNTRNLLCLRALLNLGIALGPTLGTSWSIILETLQQADLVLFSTSKGSIRSPSVSRSSEQGGENEHNSLMANFSNEVRSVETAASRLFESTIDFPDEQFVQVIQAICGLLTVQLSSESTPTQPQEKVPFKPGQGQHRRVLSFSSQAATDTNQELLFALAKLGEIASINSDRLLTSDPDKSGWELLVTQLSATLNSNTMSAPIRTRAAEVLARFMLESGSIAANLVEDLRGPIQLRLLVGLRDALTALQNNKREDSVAGNATDLEIHRVILEGLRQILENYGESLVEGWDVAFEIIGSVFVASQTIPEDGRDPNRQIGTRSSKLVRSAFGSLQLICSDFLASLPNSCFLILVDALYNFSSQNDDLNIALTTVTFFWILSDFLSGRSESLEITEKLMKAVGSTSLGRLAENSADTNSSAALWLVLLQRLTAVSSDTRLELRNSAIQTLLRIFDAYGDRLTAEAWSMCIRSVLFRLLTSLQDELQSANDDGTSDTRHEWHDTSVVVLNGISTLLANYLDVLTAHSSFNDLWKELLRHFAQLLDFKVLAINTATFKALAHILLQANEDQKAKLNENAVDLAWELWARGIPAVKTSEAREEDNQGCLLAYVGCLAEIYQLVQNRLTVKRVEKILTLLHAAAQEASFGSFASDLDNLTQLQSKIMETVNMIRTDVDGVPSAMLSHGSKLATLAFEQDLSLEKTSKRTFVALSRASITFLESVALKHAADEDIYVSGSLATTLEALCKPIALKYSFPLTTRAVQPWRVATSSSLSILAATLPQLKGLNVSKEIAQHVWFSVASLGDAILSADCESAVTEANFAADEDFDIDSFKQLRALIIPDLGAEDVPEMARKSLASSLFKTSIIHAPTDTDYEIINGESENGLSALYATRTGRTVFVPPTRRTKLAYVTFEELFALVTEEEADGPPKSKPKKKGRAKEDDSPIPMKARIASSVAPFFILRCALTLRAYVADQPLRGKMPQPLSQKHELLWTLQKLVELQSESEAIPALKGAQSKSRKHLLRLYPLLVKGLVAGGDEKVMELLREALDVIGGELGIA